MGRSKHWTSRLLILRNLPEWIHVLGRSGLRQKAGERIPPGPSRGVSDAPPSAEGPPLRIASPDRLGTPCPGTERHSPFQPVRGRGSRVRHRSAPMPRPEKPAARRAAPLAGGNPGLPGQPGGSKGSDAKRKAARRVIISNSREACYQQKKTSFLLKYHRILRIMWRLVSLWPTATKHDGPD